MNRLPNISKNLFLFFMLGLTTASLAVADATFRENGQPVVNNSISTISIALGDLDGDGDLDIFEANFIDHDNVFLNDGNGNFADTHQFLGSGLRRTRDAAIGDLDGDGDLDAIAVGQKGAFGIFLNDGNARFTEIGHSLRVFEAKSVSLGDLDGDGDLDAFIGIGDNKPNLVFVNDGTGNFLDSGQALGNAFTLDTALGDLDGDGDLDAFVVNNVLPNSIWLNNGSGQFSLGGNTPGNGFIGRSLALGDFDGDGDLDAFQGNFRRPSIVWKNDGNGNFSNSGQSLINGDSEGLATNDFDGDGDLDVVVVTGGNGPNKTWLNDGNGIFSENPTHLQLQPKNSSSIALGDLDGDGDADIVEGNENVTNRIWLNTTGEDNEPPDIVIDLATDTLTPPNHKMVLVAGISITDNTDPNPVTTVSVTSNQSSNNPVWEVVDHGNGTWSVSLRAERSGNGADRVYTVTVTSTDLFGNSATETFNVTVPHDQGKN